MLTTITITTALAAVLVGLGHRRSGLPITRLTWCVETFGRMFPRPPIPTADVPHRLLRSARRTVTIGVAGQPLVPAVIEVDVNPADLDAFADAMDWLAKDIATAIAAEAEREGWTMPYEPVVTINADVDRPIALPAARATYRYQPILTHAPLPSALAYAATELA